MSNEARTAVYVDFDNVVISRYNDRHGSGSWHKDNARQHKPTEADSEVARRLIEAQVDLGAIIDYASSFGTVALTRAYADWSMPANAAYKQQLTDRAVNLVQLFATSGTKNGADIRLAVDAIEDLLRHADLTHVVIVSGDSDYIALAQRCKEMGRFVVGIGVAKATSRALIAACDEFSSYADLPGVTDQSADSDTVEEAKSPEPRPAKKTAKANAKNVAATKETRATELLRRALQVGAGKTADGWQYAASLKTQMQRLDATFKEKTLGFSSFTDFLEGHPNVVETKLDSGQRVVRLR